MIYWIIFISSCLLFYLSNRSKSTVKYILTAIALFLPVILAAIRDESIGIDVQTYVKPMFLCAQNASSFGSYLELIKSDAKTCDLEIGFIILGYLAEKVTGGLWGVFFIYEFIIVFCIYKAVVIFNNSIIPDNNFKKVPLWMAFYCYYTVFYNMSLTMVRQSVACAVLLLGAVGLLARKYKISVLVLFIATFIHSTAVIGFAVAILYYVTRNNNILFRILYVLYLCMLMLFAVAGSKMYFFILNLINHFIHIQERYLVPEYMDFSGNDLNLAWIYHITVMTIIMGCLWLNKRQNKEITYLCTIVLTQIALIPLSVVSANAGRVLYYFMYFGIIIVPLLLNILKYKVYYNLSNYSSVALITIMYGFIYWFGTVGFNDITGTLWYKSVLF